MAQVVTGNDATFRAMNGYYNTPGLQELARSAAQTFQQYSGQIGSAILNRIESVGEQFKAMDAYNVARALCANTASMLGRRDIHALHERWQVQTAPTSMIPGIMAHPTLSRLHSKGRVAGFGNRYTELVAGANAIHNQRIHKYFMNGAVIERDDHDDEAEHDWVMNWYSDDWMEDGLEDITDHQRQDMRATYETIEHALALGRDPTDDMDALL